MTNLFNEFSLKEKKAFLDFIYYDLGKQHQDYKVTYLDKKNNEIIFSKWYNYSEICFNPKWSIISKINQRECLKNEIILDIEDKKNLGITIKKLEKFNIKYSLYSTQSKGFHVHIFYKTPVEKKRKRRIMLFESDPQIEPKHMIALENETHWKSKKIKKLLKTNILNLKDSEGYFND